MFLVLFHILRVIYILVVTSIWPLNTVVPKSAPSALAYQQRCGQYSPGVPFGATPAPARIAGLTVSMLRYRVAIMVWTFMLLGAASGDSPRLKAASWR